MHWASVGKGTALSPGIVCYNLYISYPAPVALHDVRSLLDKNESHFIIRI